MHRQPAFGHRAACDLGTDRRPECDPQNAQLLLNHPVFHPRRCDWRTDDRENWRKSAAADLYPAESGLCSHVCRGRTYARGGGDRRKGTVNHVDQTDRRRYGRHAAVQPQAAAQGLFPLVRTLKKIGVRFAPASGRQYYNLYEQFGEIADELMYISENGGMVCDGRKIVSFEAMPQQLVCAAVELARGLPNVHAIASMRDGAAYEDDDPVFVENMAMYYARRKKVPDLLAAVQQEPVCKVALFCKNAAETNVLPYYRQMFDDKLQVALSGADWVDLMRLGLSKGVAVGVMCDNLHITPAQCMAFGDYLNDVELLRSVGESYAMANAHERLKKVAKHVCPSNDEDGVCRTIRSVLAVE
ncbi:HAD family hydrolase [Agathobaculum butyriciproducens]|nr:HAD family hydrolase [Agathobaculum butyriciproducens]